MIRYLNSFLITLVLYASVIWALFTIFTNKEITINKEKPLQKTISLKHIELVPIPKLEKKVIKDVVKKKKVVEKKEVVKKKEFKKIVKKKIVKKTKKVVKKKPIKKKEIKEVTKKVEVKKIEPKKIEKKEITKGISNDKIKNIQKTNKVVKVEKIDIKKDYLSKHLHLIRKQIKKNVHYPKSAKRLKIQGIVKIRFTLHSNGSVDNIVILSGHSRLKKSTINAVKDASSSFPRVKKDITIELPIGYKLI